MVPYSSQVLDTIQNVSPVEWDATIGVAVGVCHALLSCYESGHPKAKDLRYVLLRGDQHLQAVCVAMRLGDDHDNGIERLVLGRLAEQSRFIRKCFRPALICGLLHGPGAPVLIRPGSDQDLWIPRIVDVMGAYAAEQGLALGFANVLAEQTGLIEELGRRGYYKAYGVPETKVRITWEDKNTYLKTLRAKSKNCYGMAKSEMNRFRRSGISITQWDGRNESSLYDLLKKHHQDRNDSPFELAPNFLSVIRGTIHGDCLAYVARKKEKLVGVCVLLKRGQSAWLWRVGVDHEADANSFTYFNLAYYHVFSEAPIQGLRQIRCGNAALYAKTRRGCEVELTHCFYKPRAAWSTPILRVLFSLQKLWYRHKFSPYLTTQPDGPS